MECKFSKRDALIRLERIVQGWWINERPYEAEVSNTKKKYMITFPFPYMNGRLHLGHLFSASKAEFSSRFKRLEGFNVFFPFSFHCTGMPIKACADKLMDESVNGAGAQWAILKAMGVEESEIIEFRNTKKWLEYFPPLAAADMKAFGASVDWRRSFITTNENPFFDSFIRWQFNTLRKIQKIKYGKRYTIYSKKDQQACLDHDRLSGEGVMPFEYCAIPIELITRRSLEAITNEWTIKLIVATTRPETIYGVTNIWVGPDISYGIYEGKDKIAFICMEIAAQNLAFQERLKVYGEMTKIGSVLGKELIGSFASILGSKYVRVPILPLFCLDENKGTGIVISVPSDSPTDYAGLQDIRRKLGIRETYGICLEDIERLPPVRIILTKDYPTEMIGEALCNEYKIRSQNDKLLKDANAKAHRHSFYDGEMIIGELKGMTIRDAREKVKKELEDSCGAFPYFEPENTVISRSGDKCIVALIDQWYICYGEDEWKKRVKILSREMDVYGEETRAHLDAILDWLGPWACTRSFGLGSKLPWDQNLLIESLSDSTIYMAYYTICHYLHLNSPEGFPSGRIRPEDMTDDVWSFLFIDGPVPKSTSIPLDILQKMKKEFSYFYPMDIRVSGKDLLPNHLTFMLYIHEAIFGKAGFPKGIRINGHLLLNGSKMSKSTGNFMTASEALEKFGTDATRIALADAGDSLDDANFAEDTANSAILKLSHILEFSTRLANGDLGVTGKDRSLMDDIFENKIRNNLVLSKNAYEGMHYREALKHGFYGFVEAKDKYLCLEEKPDRNLLMLYLRTFLVILSPISPHICEYIWRVILKIPKPLYEEVWPQLPEADMLILRIDDYLCSNSQNLRTIHCSSKHSRAEFYVAKERPEWQKRIIGILNRRYCPDQNIFLDEREMVSEALEGVTGKKQKSAIMTFFSDVKKKMLSGSFTEVGIPFDEFETSSKHKHILTRLIPSVSLEILRSDDSSVKNRTIADMAIPGEPSVYFY